MNMTTFKISTRITFLIAVLGFVISVVSYVGISGMHATTESLHSVYEDRTVALGHLATVQRLVARNQYILSMAVYASSTEEAAKILEEFPGNVAEVTKSFDAYMATGATAEEAQIAQAWKAKRTEYRDTGLLPIQAAVKANQKEEGLRLLREKVAPLYEEMRPLMNKLVQIQLDEAEKQYKASVVRDESSKTVSILALVVGLGFSGWFGWTLVSSIRNSLNRAIEVSQAVAQGDLTVRVPADNVDLVGVRDVVDSAGLDRVFNVLRQPYTEEPTNWSRRYKANLEKLASGDVIKVAEVVRDLYRRDLDRGLSAGEKRMLAKAKQILVSELALAERTDEEKAATLLDEVLAS